MLLSHLYKRACAKQTVQTNLAEYIVLPKLDEKEQQPFNELEIRKLWHDYGDGNKLTGYVLLMIYTGMMPGELMKCRKDMIDWDAREIRGCGAKTKKRKATPIVLSNEIIPVLADLCEFSQGEKLLTMNKDRWYKEYSAILERAGCRPLPMYSCRHTTATALALGNIAPSVIQEVMRHTHFSTTERYVHPNRTAMLDAVDSIKAKNIVNDNVNNIQEK